MKQSPIFQIAAFLFIIAAVECHPATKTIVTPAPGTDPNGGTGQFALTQTMGETSENSCRGNKMTWKKGQASWEKLQLATNLNLYQNVWQSEKVSQGGMSDITCISFNQGNLAWTNDFQMPCAPQHNNQVKTYTNVAWAGSPIQLSNVTAFKTAWNWKFTKESKDLVLDVSYDIFLTKDRNCRSQSCASREIMIWLAAVGGARPAGQRVPVNGKPSGTFKIASKYEFQVWKGVVGVPVISIFPAQEGRRFTSFQADLKQVLANLGQFGVGQDEYILSVGAGIEVFKGQGTFSTSKYTLDLY